MDPGPYGDPATRRCEFHRVGKQIGQNLFDIALIGEQSRKFFRHFRHDLDATFLGTLLHQGQAGTDDLGHVDLLLVQLMSAGLDS